jgi:3-hydroxy acid dehydrogenase / malonic semialdehyde reductase
MKKIVFISGATSGIGLACAEKFAAAGFDLIINGRRKERLETLGNELREKYNIEVIEAIFDVQVKEDVFNFFHLLPGRWRDIDILINNAGLALGRESFDEGEVEDWQTMVNTNITGLLYVTKAIVPFMTEKNSGHIINIGSVAAKDIYEKGNVYCASKAAVDALSKSMRIDLLKYGIKVTAIHPGAVETEFAEVRFKGDKSKAAATYNGFTPLTAAGIADSIFYTATLPPNVCINELVITCLAQADALHFYKKA